MSKLRKLLILLLCSLVLGAGCTDGNNDVAVATGPGVSLAAIQVTPLGKAIAKGTTLQLTATGIYTNGSSQDLTADAAWSSSNTAIATVSATGLVTGVTKGEVTITASFSGVNGTTPLTVTDASLTTVDVTPSTATVANGTTKQFRLMGTFSDGTAQDLTSQAAWTTSGNATITDLGLATGTNPGTSTITGTFQGQSDTAVLTISAATLQSIALTTPGGVAPTTVRGFSLPLTAVGTFSDGSTQDLTFSALWGTADNTIANVNTTGVVTANNVGTVVINATQNGVTGQTAFTVTNAKLVSLDLIPVGGQTVAVGANLQFQLIGNFSDGSTLDLTSAATWLSNNNNVLTVTNVPPTKGTVTGTGVGQTQVGAALLGQAAFTVVKVVPPAPLVLDVVTLDANGDLVKFNTGDPTNFTTTPVTGLPGGYELQGIDFRPSNNYLYGLAFNFATKGARLYCINPDNGVATPVGATDIAFDVQINGTAFGFDFNPLPDRVRVVNNGGQNFRIDPNTGAAVDGDPIAAGVQMDASVNGATTQADGAAYTNNQLNPLRTTLYVLDGANKMLFLQNPPNAGTATLGQTITRNGSTLGFSTVNGFDIPRGVNVTASNSPVTSGSALSVLQVGGSCGVYGIDLTSGVASYLSDAPGVWPVRGLAIRPTATPVIALDMSGTFYDRFDAADPNAVSSSINISGLAPGEELVGLDYRPSTGQLLGFGVDPAMDRGTLYILDAHSGECTRIGAANGTIAFVDGAGNPVDLPVVSLGYGFDVNPTVDRVRVVTGTGLNFRLNPVTGGAVDGDLGGAVNSVLGVNPDGPINGSGVTGVVGAAYTNNFAGATVTTLYTIDAQTSRLFVQNPPNGGTQTNALQLGVAPTNSLVGFDIRPGVNVNANGELAVGNGYAVLNVGATSNLYTVDLSTGTATLVGAINALVSDLAVGR